MNYQYGVADIAYDQLFKGLFTANGTHSDMYYKERFIDFVNNTIFAGKGL